MNPTPKWFLALAVVALLWNLAGLAAVVADLQLDEAARQALPEAQRALRAARPAWSIAGSVLAVGAGTLGCVGLLLRRRWALAVFHASLAGLVLQDLGLALAARDAGPLAPPVLVLQGAVFVVAVGLVALARQALRRGWIGAAA